MEIIKIKASDLYEKNKYMQCNPKGIRKVSGYYLNLQSN